MYQLKPATFGSLRVGDPFIADRELHVKTDDGKGLRVRDGHLRTLYFTSDTKVMRVVISHA